MFDTTVAEKCDVLPPDIDEAAAWTLRADELTSAAPGADLAYLLERGTITASDDFTVVEAVAAWRRLAAWASAGAARAAAELADRTSMAPAWPSSAGRVAEPNVAGEELAMRLGCSRQQARGLVRDGRAFRGALLWTGEALARGDIDVAKARILVEALDSAPVELALDVQEAVLPGAPGRTPRQLSRDVAAALITMDPHGARDRHAAAVCRRRLDRPRVLPDGMAGVWAVLPATDALRLDAGIDTLARTGRAAGDPRTLDQLRADILVELTVGPGPELVPRPMLSPEGQRPDATTAGGGQAREGLPRPATPPPAASPSSVGAPQPSAPRPHRASLRSQIRITVPLSSLIGSGHAPADLAGYGPITAEAAAAVALGGTWRRLVTDPLSGAVLDVGRTRYRPPAELAEHVRARDRTCARPGCSADADACDLDHTVEYGRAQGHTGHDNLGPLCPRDHTVKTDGGFRVVQVRPGVFEWTTPTGHRYVVTPGADGPVDHRERQEPQPPF